ncbi:2Fe-2S iron-sulfur cluster-binding protein [Colwelliaceae bacterium 6441]
MNLIRKIHKWSALFVGLQLLVWLGSGLFFNLMDHQKARGDHYRVYGSVQNVIDHQRLVEPQDIIGNAQAVVSLSLINLLGKPVYLLTHDKGLYRHFSNLYSLVDAYSAKPITIDAAMAKQLAIASYKGPGKINSATLIKQDNDDFPKEQNASWQINFADEVNTSVYVEVGSGRIIGHSNDDKRFADFFFMLHFMDYGNKGGFNSIQIMLFAVVTLWLALTGFIWTLQLGFNGQYQTGFFTKQRNIQLFNKNQQSLGSVTLNSKDNLLAGLSKKNIFIPSNCGGGGTCGSCRILLTANSPITSAEQEKLSQALLAKGYRLSCQQFLADIDCITLLNK